MGEDTDKIWKKAYGSLETCLLHTSTFGGNARACACGIAALNTLIDGDVIENARNQGEYLLSRLDSLRKKFPFIKDVRGKGLMIGIQLAKLKGKGSLVEGALALLTVRQLFRRHRIISAFTLNNYDVIRIMPPLNVSKEHIDQLLEGLEDILSSARFLNKLQVVQGD